MFDKKVVGEDTDHGSLALLLLTNLFAVVDVLTSFTRSGFPHQPQ